mgnify:CR=1 FL=1
MSPNCELLVVLLFMIRFAHLGQRIRKPKLAKLLGF